MSGNLDVQGPVRPEDLDVQKTWTSRRPGHPGTWTSGDLDVRKTWMSGRPGCPGTWMSVDLDVRGPGCLGTWMSGDLDVRDLDVQNLDVWDLDVCLSMAGLQTPNVVAMTKGRLPGPNSMNFR